MFWFIQAPIWLATGMLGTMAGEYIALIPCVWLCILSIILGYKKGNLTS